MNFYVYAHAHARNKHVRVHTGRCGYCNEGKGRLPIQQLDNRWYGPYYTLEAAQAFAKTLKIKDTRACQTCLWGSKPASTW